MEFIASNGGPLICLESKLKADWGGIERLTLAQPGAGNDYDRACDPTGYVNVIALTNGVALVLGEEVGAETSVWRAPSGIVTLVQVPCAEPNTKETPYLEALSDAVFQDPIASVEFAVASDDLLVFDSAEPGYDLLFPSLSFRIDPGRYRILVQRYDPDPEISFVLYQFRPIGAVAG